MPVYYEDNPSSINYPGENSHVLYGKGIIIGYRYDEMKYIEPLFPFGHGFSYTRFAYENLRIGVNEVEPGGEVTV